MSHGRGGFGNGGAGRGGGHGFVQGQNLGPFDGGNGHGHGGGGGKNFSNPRGASNRDTGVHMGAERVEGAISTLGSMARKPAGHRA